MALAGLLSLPSIAGGGGLDPLGGAATSSAYSDTGSVNITQAAPFTTGGGGVPWGTIAVAGLAILAVVAAMRR